MPEMHGHREGRSAPWGAADPEKDVGWQPAEQAAPGLAQILQQLDQCKSYPDFNNYLAFIFAQGDSLPIEVRPNSLSHTAPAVLHSWPCMGLVNPLPASNNLYERANREQRRVPAAPRCGKARACC